MSDQGIKQNRTSRLKHSSGITRRTFLAGSMAASTLLLTNPLEARRKQRTTATGDCGVASGDPRPDSVVLWTRIPDAFQDGGSGELRVDWDVSTSAGFDSIVKTGYQTTSADIDFTVTVKVTGLNPYTRYYYRFRSASGYISVTGRTQTAPSADADLSALRFAFISCENYPQGYYNALASLAQEDVDFCVSLGDNIYESGGTGVRTDNIGEIEPGRAITLNDFRSKFKLYLSDANLREVRRLFPWIVIWDDHEVFDNYAGGDMTSDERDIQTAGYTAFREYMPLDPGIQLSSDATATSLTLYRQFTFGRLLDVFAMDERQYRDGVVCGRDFASFGCDELYAPDRTMLGTDQLDWLKAGLRTSQAQWKILLNEVVMMAMKLSRGVVPAFQHLEPVETYDGFLLNLDQWDGFPAERTALLQYIADEAIPNVVVCTGDVHNCYAGVLRPDFDRPSTPAVAVEIVGGSVSSYGIAEYLNGKDVTNAVSKALKPVNPHLQYMDLKYHVYTIVEVSPEQLAATYIAMDTVTSETFSTFELQRLTVPAGSAELILESPSAGG